MEQTVKPVEESSYVSASEKRNEVLKKALDGLMDPVYGMSDEEKAAYRNRVMAKLKDGKDLTAEEMNYLKLHDPDMYRTAMRVKNKKELLKEQLKRCRTKAQVNMLIGQVISAVSKEDPDRQYLVAGLRYIAEKFKKSSRYARLPETEEEITKKKKKELLFLPEEKDSSDEEDKWIKTFAVLKELMDQEPDFQMVE